MPLPPIVAEILLGIVVGPQVLAWAAVDAPVEVLALVGLAFLLLLAGLEIDLDLLRGRRATLALAGFAVSFALAVALGVALSAGGLVRSPLLIAVILSATSLGIVLPVLKDASMLGTPVGQMVVAGGTVAEILPILLLSVLFSEQGPGIVAQLALLVAFLAFVVAVAAAILGLEHSRRLSDALVALQDTTSQIRVRGAVLLLMLLAALAAEFGLEAILGAFLAGATLKLVDRDDAMTHTRFASKLQAVGFGTFVPFFFVATGMQLDVEGLLGSGSTMARVPVFVVCLLLVRALPALLYRPVTETRGQVVAAGLLQATSLSIPIVAGQIGVDLGLIRPENYVALVAAGLVSVVLFPIVALRLLGAEATRA
ncbi:MAG: hypothetical protein AVDCRST_MAG45-2572 [uncultured Solirubrobacterales bacterium]|uniref:Cation/H+ exchanger transmembrane domain-containing protein n=1 Tax=uncultured Solirubrobacterales bacterium TaxID=768556 RepID=A0A6J4TFP9_9ACTN|nr:MAG: hypothetical protein AVDCRST_MAG45-2572 [uncultured Solirubrobacterales bacterium]